MEQKPPKPQTPFDSLVIPQQLQMMKLLLPYISSSTQSMLAIFIKFQELKYTIRYFKSSEFLLKIQSENKDQLSFMNMIEEFIPYLEKEQGDMIQNVLSAMQMMEMAQNMFSPEQQEMFEFYSNMFSQDTENAYDNNEFSKNNEEKYGKMDESSESEES